MLPDYCHFASRDFPAALVMPPSSVARKQLQVLIVLQHFNLSNELSTIYYSSRSLLPNANVRSHMWRGLWKQNSSGPAECVYPSVWYFGPWYSVGADIALWLGGSSVPGSEFYEFTKVCIHWLVLFPCDRAWTKIHGHAFSLVEFLLEDIRTMICSSSPVLLFPVWLSHPSPSQPYTRLPSCHRFIESKLKAHLMNNSGVGSGPWCQSDLVIITKGKPFPYAG